jgi:hypothetical protein
MTAPKNRKAGKRRRLKPVPAIISHEGKYLGKAINMYFEPQQLARVLEIAEYEDRTQAQVVRTLLWLGLGVYERLAHTLAARPELSDTPLADKGAPSPSPSIMRWFVEQELGRTILDNEAHDIILRERAVRKAERERLHANLQAIKPTRITPRERREALENSDYGKEESTEWT